MLSPGYGTSSLAFTIDTVDTNFPEFLYANGYDVWLFDYRASPALPSARTQFTLDDVATKDYPAAVAQVRAITGAPDIQIVAHCIGSLTFLMSMLSGKLQGIRSACLLASGLLPDNLAGEQTKGGLRYRNLLQEHRHRHPHHRLRSIQMGRRTRRRSAEVGGCGLVLPATAQYAGGSG